MSVAAPQPLYDGVAEEEQVLVDPKLENEHNLVNKRTGLGEMPEGLLADFGFAVNRLHDPCNFDHTTLEEMLSTYHFRDLQKSKLFRLAKKIFGEKMDSKFRIRKRTFNLTGINTGYPVITGSVVKPVGGISKFEACEETVEEEDEDLVDMNDLRLRPLKPIVPTRKQNACFSEDHTLATDDDLDEYNRWLEERKQLRSDINSLGLKESWLQNKPDRTDMENLLYEQLLADQYAAMSTRIDQERGGKGGKGREGGKSAETLPRIRRPSPIAIRKLDAFLRSKKLRLIDIFSAIDKDKNWHLSKDEFKNAVDQYGMDISSSLLEDLITTLDVDQNGEVSYKELVKGLDLYQKEKRDLKNKGLPMPQDDNPEEVTTEGITPTSRQASAASSRPRSSRVSSGKEGSSPKSASTSREQSRGSSATTLLATPEPDLQESRLVLKSKELQTDFRKRDKNFLHYYNKSGRPSSNSRNRKLLPSMTQSSVAVFKTGYKPVDDHCRPSRLEGETGTMTNSFRQLKLKEYHNIIKLCETEGVALSQKLLDKVLLHPGDKTTRLMLKQGIRQPGANLPLSRHFAEPPKRPRTPIEIRNKGKIKRGRDGKLLIDYKHRFPSHAKATPTATKVQLSTGKALIARKVDCWMTFEEYEDMTREFYTKRYVQMESSGDKSELTWPGYMLDKMRIYMDKDPTGEPSNALFHGVKRETKPYHGYDNDLNNWQVSDAGYLSQGDLRHPKKQYNTNNLQPKVTPEVNPKNYFVHKNTADLTMHTKNTVSVDHKL